MIHSPTNWKEPRRLQAWRLKPKGWSQRQNAEALSVSERAVSQWMTRARDRGPDTLRHRPPPGARRRLSDELLAPLHTLLHRDPKAYGFRGAVWTRSRIAAVIRAEYGIFYQHVHVSRVSRAMHWSPQKPARHPCHRDEAAIVHWCQVTWPAIKEGRKPRSDIASFWTNPGSTPCPV